MLQPRLIVPVGGLAVRQLLGLPSLDAGVGQPFDHGEAVAVPLPHPSGVSRWMNNAENQQRVERAVELIHAELKALKQPWDRYPRPPPHSDRNEEIVTRG